MRQKDLLQKLNMTADRLKLFRREGIFVPENEAETGKNLDYTCRDFQELKLILELSNAGLTCSDIRKIRQNDLEAEAVIQHRISVIREDIRRKTVFLDTLNELRDDTRDQGKQE